MVKGHLISTSSGGFSQLNGVAGREINDILADTLAAETSLYFTKSYDRELYIRDIKELCCSVHLSGFEKDKVAYELPGGRTINLSHSV